MTRKCKTIVAFGVASVLLGGVLLPASQGMRNLYITASTIATSVIHNTPIDGSTGSFTTLSASGGITGTLTGNASSATNAVHASSADQATHASAADQASLASALNGTTNCPQGQYATGIDTSGNAQCVAPPARQCNGNGCYVQQPDGTIHAWGRTNGGSGSAARVTASFPISMNNVNVTVSAVNEAAGDGNPHPMTCSVSSTSTTGLTAVIALATQVTGSGYDHLTGNEYCSWTADGNL